jgi:hypothetical protein
LHLYFAIDTAPPAWIYLTQWRHTLPVFDLTTCRMGQWGSDSLRDVYPDVFPINLKALFFFNEPLDVSTIDALRSYVAALDTGDVPAPPPPRPAAIPGVTSATPVLRLTQLSDLNTFEIGSTRPGVLGGRHPFFRLNFTRGDHLSVPGPIGGPAMTLVAKLRWTPQFRSPRHFVYGWFLSAEGLLFR